MLPKVAKESNASALDAGLDALIAFFENNTDGGSLPEQITPLLIKSGFGGRPAIVKKALSVILKALPSNALGYDPVIDAVLAGLKEKKPKIPPVCIQCLVEALQMYGAVSISLADIIEKLPSLMGSTKKDTREKAKVLIVEIYRWTGHTRNILSYIVLPHTIILLYTCRPRCVEGVHGQAQEGAAE